MKTIVEFFKLWIGAVVFLIGWALKCLGEMLEDKDRKKRRGETSNPLF